MMLTLNLYLNTLKCLTTVFLLGTKLKKHKTKKAVWYDPEHREPYKSQQLLYKNYI